MISDATEWQAWSRLQLAVDPAAPLPRLTALPMMTARRLNSGSKLAVDIGLAMLQNHAIDAVVYSSRHGELERNYRILHALATGQSVSPTDFAMSVHNSAVGNLTITARRHRLVIHFCRAGHLPAGFMRSAEPAACGLFPRPAGRL